MQLNCNEVKYFYKASKLQEFLRSVGTNAPVAHSATPSGHRKARVIDKTATEHNLRVRTFASQIHLPDAKNIAACI